MSDFPLLAVVKAEYLGGYKLNIVFNDGHQQQIDFESFICNAINPNINKYRDLALFKAYRITDGDLEWNDFDLCFPIADLYENKHIERTGSSMDAA